MGRVRQREPMAGKCPVWGPNLTAVSLVTVTESLLAFRRPTVQQRDTISKLMLSGKMYLLHNVSRSRHCNDEIGNLHVNIQNDKLVFAVLSDVIVIVTSVFKIVVF